MASLTPDTTTGTSANKLLEDEPKVERWDIRRVFDFMQHAERAPGPIEYWYRFKESRDGMCKCHRSLYNKVWSEGAMIFGPSKGWYGVMPPPLESEHHEVERITRDFVEHIGGFLRLILLSGLGLHGTLFDDWMFPPRGSRPEPVGFLKRLAESVTPDTPNGRFKFLIFDLHLFYFRSITHDGMWEVLRSLEKLFLTHDKGEVFFAFCKAGLDRDCKVVKLVPSPEAHSLDSPEVHSLDQIMEQMKSPSRKVHFEDDTCTCDHDKPLASKRSVFAERCAATVESGGAEQGFRKFVEDIVEQLRSKEAMAFGMPPTLNTLKVIVDELTWEIPRRLYDCHLYGLNDLHCEETSKDIERLLRLLGYFL
ncbi:hypothetical protein F4778DRAFT_785684 [Xylariomycetidae sp. FL2044]|nr:hypothetical protein F4778DRAFT_785684 [Xylariomycetidae sp. FL2044]